MHPSFSTLINDATQLVRGGNLQAATAAIQRALRGNAPPAAAPVDEDGDVIDIEAREVPCDEPREAPPNAPRHRGNDRFLSGRHAWRGRECDYKLYVPACRAGERVPLVVMLHGCTQDPDDFAAGTRMNEEAAARGFLVLYPAQSQKANASRCWNWFKHSHQQRGRGEPELLASLTRHVMQTHPVDADRVYIAGLSAGGAMAAVIAGCYPELFASVGVHSGLAPGTATDLVSALAAMKRGPARASGATPQRSESASALPPTIVFHGDSDPTVHPRNGDGLIAACGVVNPDPPQHGSTPDGRRHTCRSYRDAEGRVRAEQWLLHGAGHAWSGGSTKGSHTDCHGPDATKEMLRFFLAHPRRG